MDEYTSFAVATVALYGSLAGVAIAAMHYGYLTVTFMALAAAMLVKIETGDD